MVGAEIWRPVMERAGYRCECRGECGKRHTLENSTGVMNVRCGVFHSDQHRLVAAIATLDGGKWGNPYSARNVRLGLYAICPDCYDRTNKLIKSQEPQLPEQEGLF